MICLIAEKLLGIDLEFFMGVNALFGLFNLAPVLPLDGGRVLYSILSMKLNIDDADLITRGLGIIISVFGIYFGVMLLISNKGNFTLLLISLLIFMRNALLTQAL